MSDLRELYQEVILDHSRHPRNQTLPEDSNHKAQGHNPLCGDELSLELRVDDDVISAIGFHASGCAISTASASTMSEVVKGKSVEEANALFEGFHALVTGKSEAPDLEQLGKLAVFSGVSQYPMRVKCASLAWHTLRAALDDAGEATTE